MIVGERIELHSSGLSVLSSPGLQVRDRWGVSWWAESCCSSKNIFYPQVWWTETSANQRTANWKQVVLPKHWCPDLIQTHRNVQDIYLVRKHDLWHHLHNNIDTLCKQQTHTRLSAQSCSSHSFCFYVWAEKSSKIHERFPVLFWRSSVSWLFPFLSVFNPWLVRVSPVPRLFSVSGVFHSGSPSLTCQMFWWFWMFSFRFFFFQMPSPAVSLTEVTFCFCSLTPLCSALGSLLRTGGTLTCPTTHLNIHSVFPHGGGTHLDAHVHELHSLTWSQVVTSNKLMLQLETHLMVSPVWKKPFGMLRTSACYICYFVSQNRNYIFPNLRKELYW